MIPIKIQIPNVESACVVHKDKWINMIKNCNGIFESEIITSNYDQKNEKIEILARDSKFVLIEFAIYEDPNQFLSELL